MTSPVYATPEQYRTETGDVTSSDDQVQAILPRASLRLDEILVGVIYDTDTDGMPTDTGTAEVFMRATCAQAQFMLVQDDPTGAKHGFTNVSVGSVSYSRAPESAGVGADRYAPDAVSILHVEGVLPVNTLSYY